MKRLFVYFLLVSLLAPILSPWGTVAYFILNRACIEKTLCENRDKPQLNCNGQCYLAKKLKQQKEAGEKEALENLKSICWSPLYIHQPELFRFRPFYRPVASRGFTHKAHFSYASALSRIFRPPR